MADKLYPVRFSRPYRNYNPGEVAGFDLATVRTIVKSDAGEPVKVDQKTGKIAGTLKLDDLEAEDAKATASSAPAGGSGK